MKLAVIALALLPAIAQAQVYKCVASDGSTSYSAVPCPTGAGESTRIIEPVPPSGPLNIPVTEAPVDEATTDSEQSESEQNTAAPTVTGITVLKDSDEQRRDEKRTQMREDDLQHKKDLYDADLRRKERFDEMEFNYQKQQQQQQQQQR